MVLSNMQYKQVACQCEWTNSWKIDNERNCTFSVRPWPDTNEGLSDWVPQIVSDYLLAIQKGCRLYFHYREGIDIHQVFTPLSSSINWTVPDGLCVTSGASKPVKPTKMGEGISVMMHLEILKHPSVRDTWC